MLPSENYVYSLQNEEATQLTFINSESQFLW